MLPFAWRWKTGGIALAVSALIRRGAGALLACLFLLTAIIGLLSPTRRRPY
ncbi:hypothetical protein [Stutzerimonas xanthomarina]|uniref:hypothetical protein n=1 Tax=Stutzerimonas xanthomarina TaxID=271420 RepID=UPI003AA7C590